MAKFYFLPLTWRLGDFFLLSRKIKYHRWWVRIPPPPPYVSMDSSDPDSDPSFRLIIDKLYPDPIIIQ